MFIGLVLGWLAVRSTLKAKPYRCTPRRWPCGRFRCSIINGRIAAQTHWPQHLCDGPRHIHHRMLTHGLTPRQTVSLIGGLCLITSLGAVFEFILSTRMARLGWDFNCVLLTRRVAAVWARGVAVAQFQGDGFGRALVKWGGNRRSNQTTQQLQGKLQWEEKIWIALIESPSVLALNNSN